MKNNFRISEAEKLTPVWAKTESYLKQMIEQYRSELEKPNKSAMALNDDVLRGCILAYRRLLSKAENENTINDNGT